MSSNSATNQVNNGQQSTANGAATSTSAATAAPVAAAGPAPAVNTAPVAATTTGQTNLVNAMNGNAAYFTGIMPKSSMYAAENATPCDIYRSRNGIMLVKTGYDDELTGSSGMYINKATINPQTYSAPSCGRVYGTKSSCGTISEMITKLAESDIAGLSPSDRNSIDMFSARSIARLARAQEKKDEVAVAQQAASDAAQTKQPVQMGAMMDKLNEKSAATAEDIVQTEEQVKYDVLGRPCAPGTYFDKSNAAYKPMLQNQLVGGADLSLMNAMPSLTQQPMFASLRPQSAVSATTSASATTSTANGAAAITNSSNLLPAAPSNLGRVSESQAQSAMGAAALQQATNDAVNAGTPPTVTAPSFTVWQIVGMVALALLILLAIISLIYWLMNRGKDTKPKGRLEKTAAAGASIIDTGVNAITGAATGLFNAGKSAVTSAAEGVVQAGSQTLNAAGNVAGNVLDVGKSAADTVTSTGSALLQGNLKGAGDAAVSGLTNTAREAVQTVTDAGSDVVGVAGTALNTVGDVGKSAVDAGSAVLGGAADLATGTVAGTVDVAKAATGLGSSPDASETSVAEDASEADSSVGVNDIDSAFAAAPAPAAENAAASEAATTAAEATEDLQNKTDALEQQAADLLKNTEDVSTDSANLANQVNDIQATLGDTK